MTHEDLWQPVTLLELLAWFTVEKNGLWCRPPVHLLSEANHDSSSPLKDTLYLDQLSCTWLPLKKHLNDRGGLLWTHTLCTWGDHIKYIPPCWHHTDSRSKTLFAKDKLENKLLDQVISTVWNIWSLTKVHHLPTLPATMRGDLWEIFAKCQHYLASAPKMIFLSRETYLFVSRIHLPRTIMFVYSHLRCSCKWISVLFYCFCMWGYVCSVQQHIPKNL